MPSSKIFTRISYLPALEQNFAPKRRVEFLDGLRACAALFVLLYHIALQVHVPLTMYGHYAVGLFIVLSGCSLMLPIVRGDGTLRGGAVRFFQGRVRRILPPYYLAIMTTLFLGQALYPTPDRLAHLGVADGWTHLLLAHNLFEKTTLSINPVLWSIAVEWQIYFLFPALVFLWSRFGGGRATLIAAVFSALWTIVLLATPLNTKIHGAMTHYIALFAAGALAADVLYSQDSRLTALRTRLPWSVITGCLFVVLLGCYKFRFWASGHNFILVDLITGAAAFSLLLSAQGGRIHRFLSNPILVSIGSFSYSLYLMHMPIIWFLSLYVIDPLHTGKGISLVVMILLGVPLSLLFSYGFFRFAERPFLSENARAQADAVLNGVLSPFSRRAAVRP